MTQRNIFVPRGPFQTAATQFLLQDDRRMIAVDMGLGKTTMTLNAIDALVRCGESHPFLILAPLRVARTTWKDELSKWEHLSHLNISPIVGTEKERLAALKKDVPIYTCNYENLIWLTQQLEGKWKFRNIVVDEATKLKAHRAHYRRTSKGEALCCTGGARTTALARIAFKKVQRFWELTGSLGSNSLLQIWPLIWYLDGGERLGKSYTSFQDRWFKVGYNGFDIEPLPHAEGEIREKIKDLVFTLLAKDYLELGEEIYTNIYVDLPANARIHYDEMEKEFYTQVKNKEIEAFTAATKSSKMQQIGNGAIYHDRKGNWEPIHKAKIEALESIVEEANGMPLIVVYKYVSDLERLKKAFPEGKALNDNVQVEQQFKRGEIQILFVHPASAGHGIDSFQNVTNILVFFSLDWDAELRSQVVARIGAVRQFQAGFQRPVFIYQIVARDTIDCDILERIDKKLTMEETLKRGLARVGLK